MPPIFPVMPMLLYNQHHSSPYLTGEAGGQNGQTTGPDSCEWAGDVPAGQRWDLEAISHQAQDSQSSHKPSEMTRGVILVLDDFYLVPGTCKAW